MTVGQLVDLIAQRTADLVVEQLRTEQPADSEPRARGADEWLDTKEAASYLGMHCDTLRKLAAANAIRSQQDRPGCKRRYRRSELDAWIEAGGAPAHLRSVV
ncbi:MAG: helix-turn-helix domain-containing protein [Solirubrobacteraceae bacterium]